MNTKKRSLIVSIVLFIIAILFTIMVKTVDVKPSGVNSTEIGFSTLNLMVSEKIGTNMMLYKITQYIGLLPILSVFVYGFIGLHQLISRKSLKRVDPELYALGGFYAIVTAIYFLFEKIIINYRPILMEGMLEASYPSSHTMMTICFCGGLILVNKQLFDGKITKIINILSIIVAIVMVTGRLLSGVHWFTDIIGGILISAWLIMILKTVFDEIKYED